MTLVMYGSPRGLKAVPAARPHGTGSIVRTGTPVAGDRPDTGGQGQPRIDDFMDEVQAGFRRRLTLLGDCGERRAIEDGIALLAQARLRGIDRTRFELLLSTLCEGRSPAGLPVLRPMQIGRDLTRLWQEYVARDSAAE